MCKEPITASIYNKKITISNIYGPNSDNPSFFNTFFSTLQESTDIIIGGNFNTVINPTTDRSSTAGNLRSWHSTELLKQYMTDFGLGDSWRLSNPSSREYTYFSPLHQSFSRLDFFLISNTFLSKVSKTTIHPIIISDHAPVSLSIKMESNVKYSSRWRFNTSLLKDSDFTALIQREWASFLELNDSPEISSSILWETGKAVIRGQIISYYTNTHTKKEQELEKHLEQKMKQLTDIYSNNPKE